MVVFMQNYTLILHFYAARVYISSFLFRFNFLSCICFPMGFRLVAAAIEAACDISPLFLTSEAKTKQQPYRRFVAPDMPAAFLF